eukprot:gnl/MRDRNA2_/MRDRNA2_58349_c0_seq1.p1 gnl/MRDRNA2_/MRDRNA2_58349_c0~~gnl/MRDRNA2_/MRDRNA2_58349_c0_seq1.p1  ORF type:complete len:531 (+),score=104.78 gnl/MRDRNA2_/MRDRNA2_58349_c0_seq1:1-1593(+)
MKGVKTGSLVTFLRANIPPVVSKLEASAEPDTKSKGRESHDPVPIVDSKTITATLAPESEWERVKLKTRADLLQGIKTGSLVAFLHANIPTVVSKLEPSAEANTKGKGAEGLTFPIVDSEWLRVKQKLHADLVTGLRTGSLIASLRLAIPHNNLMQEDSMQKNEEAKVLHSLPPFPPVAADLVKEPPNVKDKASPMQPKPKLACTTNGIPGAGNKALPRESTPASISTSINKDPPQTMNKKSFEQPASMPLPTSTKPCLGASNGNKESLTKPTSMHIPTSMKPSLEASSKELPKQPVSTSSSASISKGPLGGMEKKLISQSVSLPISTSNNKEVPKASGQELAGQVLTTPPKPSSRHQLPPRQVSAVLTSTLADTTSRNLSEQPASASTEPPRAINKEQLRVAPNVGAECLKQTMDSAKAEFLKDVSASTVRQTYRSPVYASRVQETEDTPFKTVAANEEEPKAALNVSAECLKHVKDSVKAEFLKDESASPGRQTPRSSTPRSQASASGVKDKEYKQFKSNSFWHNFLT